jgi:multisubunit Na+/H+ antiporter MnhB subunit
VPEANGANVVNVTLVDFRAMDTLGEITVLGVAALGVLALTKPFADRIASGGFRVKPSLILSQGATIAGPFLLIFALYLLLAGHNQPGGGFAAGLVASGWLVLRWLDRRRAALAFQPSVLIGSGLALALVVAFGGYLWADAFAASAAWTIDLPMFGEVKTVTSLALDIGVAILVFGAVGGAVKGLEAS